MMANNNKKKQGTLFTRIYKTLFHSGAFCFYCDIVFMFYKYIYMNCVCILWVLLCVCGTIKI